MADNEEGWIDQRLLQALSHPLRVRILEALDGRVASPAQLSELLGAPLHSVAYHTRVLAKCDCLELRKTEMVRGAVQHFYTSKTLSLLDSKLWLEIPPSLRGGVAATAFDCLSRRLLAALRSDTFRSRPGANFNCATLKVDDDGWTEVVEIIATAERALRKTAKRSAERLDKEQGLTLVVSLGAFEAGRPDSDESDERARTDRPS